MLYIEEEMWENLPQSFILYCKEICDENNYETGSEPTTPTATTVKGKEIAINSLRRLSVITEGVEETTINTTIKGACPYGQQYQQRYGAQ